MVINPPAPKVPRRDSLGVEATGQICQTGAASDVGPYSPGRRCQKVRETVVICTLFRSAQHRPNAPSRSDVAATLARLGVKTGQQDRSGPASAQHDQAAPTWAPVGFKIVEVGPKLPNPLKTCIFTASSNLFWL